MNNLKLASLVILTSVAMTGAPGRAAEAEATTNSTPEQVFSRYVQVRGGQAAFDKVATVSANGTFENVEGIELNGTAAFEMLIKAPDKVVMNVTDASGPFFRQALDGIGGWRGVRTDLHEFTPEQAAFVRSLLQIYLGNKLPEFFQKPVMKGKESVRNHEACIIEAGAPQGRLFKLFFDTQTGLLLRFTTDLGGISLRYDYDDFRVVGEIKMPYQITAQEGDIQYSIRLKDVKLNTPIDDAKFKKPTT